MIVHPQFDPVAIHLGPLAIHWYGLMYLLGFGLFLLLGNYRIRQGHAFLTSKLLDDLLMYGVLGVVIGGRLGEVLFYEPGYYFSHPAEIFMVWKGGMSFHGGFLGVLVGMALFARKQQRSFWELTDFIAPLVPLGLAAGRIGNFINGELWGRVASPDLPWAMLFPSARANDLVEGQTSSDLLNMLMQYGALPRHPRSYMNFAGRHRPVRRAVDLQQQAAPVAGVGGVPDRLRSGALSASFSAIRMPAFSAIPTPSAWANG
jgi:phosphatidylglycerol:prolipoprotein diacylglycerol transferase